MTVASFLEVPPFSRRCFLSETCVTAMKLKIDPYFPGMQTRGVFSHLDPRKGLLSSVWVTKCWRLERQVFELDLLEKNKYRMTKGNLNG